jgi:DnaJ-domain-containing protein 1
MPDPSLVLYLLLAGGAGFAFVYAAREFLVGLQEARQEHTTRMGGGDPNGDKNKTSYDRSDEPPRREANSFPRPWHEVLEVTVVATPEEIRTAYRRMIALYHPDRVNDLGADLKVVAERRAKEINGAYAAARKLRKF